MRTNREYTKDLPGKWVLGSGIALKVYVWPGDSLKANLHYGVLMGPGNIQEIRLDSGTLDVIVGQIDWDEIERFYHRRLIFGRDEEIREAIEELIQEALDG